MRRSLLLPFVCVAALVRPAPIQAHRLDEYLQASRLSIAADRIGIELDLTPGVSVAKTVSAWIDKDDDGAMSAAEEQQYAREVVGGLVLSVDGVSTPIRLTDARFPGRVAFARGDGIIQIRADAPVRLTAGRHHLAYANAHHAETSVFLVNALVPADPRLTIVAQQRDPLQHGLALDYDDAPAPVWRAAFAAAGFGLVAVAIVIRRSYATVRA